MSAQVCVRSFAPFTATSQPLPYRAAVAAAQSPLCSARRRSFVAARPYVAASCVPCAVNCVPCVASAVRRYVAVARFVTFVCALYVDFVAAARVPLVCVRGCVCARSRCLLLLRSRCHTVQPSPPLESPLCSARRRSFVAARPYVAASCVPCAVNCVPCVPSAVRRYVAVAHFVTFMCAPYVDFVAAARVPLVCLRGCGCARSRRLRLRFD